MATKGYYAEQVIRQLNGADIIIDEQADLRLLFSRLDKARNSFIFKYYASLNEYERRELMGSYAVPFYNVTIQYDNDRKQYYCDLPAKVLGIQNDLGVYKVSFIEDFDNDFIRIPLGSMSMYRGMVTSNFEGRIGWTLEGGKKLYFPTLSQQAESYEGKKLHLLLLCDSAEIDLDAEYYIPAEFEEDIINQVFQTMSTFKNPQIGNTQFEGRAK